ATSRRSTLAVRTTTLIRSRFDSCEIPGPSDCRTVIEFRYDRPAVGAPAVVTRLPRLRRRYLLEDRRFLARLLIAPAVALIVALPTIAFTWILDPTFSILSWAMEKTHTLGAFCGLTGIQNCSVTSPPNWVGQTTLAKISIITVHSWRILPFATVIFLAGIASIPREVDDAAAVDGATGLRKFWYISLPLQLPIAIIAVLFGIVFTATDMTVTYVLTHGGPYNSTH